MAEKSVVFSLKVNTGNSVQDIQAMDAADLDAPVFWYIIFDESIVPILGQPTTFEVTIEE